MRAHPDERKPGAGAISGGFCYQECDETELEPVEMAMLTRVAKKH